MKILFDYSAFTIQDVGGVSRSMVELFKSLSTYPESKVKVFAGIHQNKYLQDLPPHCKKNVVGIYAGGRFYKQTIFKPVNKFLFQIYSLFFNADIHQRTYYDGPETYGKTKSSVYIYDLIHELFPDASGAEHQKIWKKEAICKSDAIICISENTKGDLQTFYSTENKLCVHIPLGVSISSSKIEVNPCCPFFLYVGSRHQPYKNFSALLSAFSMLKSFKELKLICFGGGAFTQSENSFFSDNGLNDRVKQISGDDALLSAYYQQATALIYPSTYEGFGLPPLEAMSLGCPVISSSAPPMNTLLSGAAIFFNLDDPQALAEQMERLLRMDETGRQEILHRGKTLAAQFTWEKAGANLYHFYQSLLDSNPKPPE